MSVSSRDLRRIAPLLALCLLLGGCVYLRLLQLKYQLADFDRYFAVNETDGLAFTLKKPVLLTDDMAFFEVAPESIDKLGAAQLWHLRWIKDYAAPDEKAADYEVTADFTFVDGKLARVHLPERIFSFVPKSLILQTLRSLGHASINKLKQSAHATLDLTPLTRADLLRFLGAPLDTHRDSHRILLHYRYTGVSTLQTPGKIDFIFTIDAGTQTVVHLDGKLFKGTMQFDLPATQPKIPATTDKK